MQESNEPIAHPRVQMRSPAIRDRVCRMARTEPVKAENLARKESDPWYRAQALAYVARYSENDTVRIAALAAETARYCKDSYCRSAVRAWEIAALAERGYLDESALALKEALSESQHAMPPSSRAEAQLLLLQASLKIDASVTTKVHDELKRTCENCKFWRCRRALRWAQVTIGTPRLGKKFFVDSQ